MKSRTGLVAIIVVLTIMVGTILINVNAREFIVERNGIRLSVPAHYLAGNFWWLEFAKGLDSSEGEVLIQVPSNEIRELLPRDAPEVVEFSTFIHILDDAEAAQAEMKLSQTASEINRQQGKYSEQRVVKDEVTGWYRLYGIDSDIFGWLVVKRQPPVNATDIVARCVREASAVVTSCDVSQFVMDGIALEMTIRFEHLPYHEEIKQYLMKLVQTWRVKSVGKSH